MRGGYCANRGCLITTLSAKKPAVKRKPTRVRNRKRFAVMVEEQSGKASLPGEMRIEAFM
jgi:hypothetical protein